MSVELKDFGQLQEDFRVNYFGNVQGQPTAVTERFGSALALMLDEWYAALGEIQAKFYLGTAQGTDLDDRIADFGLTRPEAAKAMIPLRFSRPTAATVDYPIPVGTVAQRADGTRYTTQTAAVLPAGALSVDVVAACATAGDIGNALPGTINVLPAAPAGISAVTNPDPVNNGSEAMSDEALRVYTAEYLASLAKGTLAAVKTGASGVSGIRDVSVFEDKYARALIYILIADASGTANPQLIEAVRLELRNWKPAGCRTKIAGSTRVQLSLDIVYGLAEGYEARQDEVELNLAQSGIDYINGHKIGQGVYHDRVLAALNNVEGVGWASLLCPATDVAMKFYEKPFADLGHTTVSKAA